MTKSIKFKNDIYLDSKSIVHNKSLLSGILNTLSFSNYGAYNNLNFNELRNRIGIYHGRDIPNNANCQNYPINETGDLLVFSFDNSFAYQFYCVHNGKLYFRGFYREIGWSEWKKIC